MSRTICKIENFSFQYEEGADLTFKSMDLKINENEVIVIIGKNGSGKSTFLSLLGKSIPSHQLGKKIGTIKIEAETTIIYQRPQSQILTYRIDEELLTPLSFRGIDRKSRKKYLEDLTKNFNIADSLDKDPRNLSAGNQQKIVVLSVYGTQAPIFLLDEPTTLLDKENRIIVLDLLKNLQSAGKTIVITTHNPHYYIDIANKFFKIEKKQLFEIPKKMISITKYPKNIQIPDISHNHYNLDFQIGYNSKLLDIQTVIPKIGIVLVLGKNGIGKTTLLLTLTSIIQPYEGKFKFQKKSLFVPVDPSTFFWKPLVKNELPKDMEKSDWIRDIHNQSPFTLSFGQKKLLAMEISFFEADIVLIDEPTQSLDSEFRVYLFKKLVKLSTNKLIILASNDDIFIEAINRYCSKIINLEDFHD